MTDTRTIDHAFGDDRDGPDPTSTEGSGEGRAGRPDRGTGRAVDPRWYRFGLVGVALVGLAVRFTSILLVRPTCQEDIVALIEQPGGPPASGGGTECFGIWGDTAYSYIQG